MCLKRALTAGLSQEGDPEGLHKTGSRQRPGQREHGASKGKHQPNQAICAAEALEQRLIGQPLADETVERGQGRYCHRAHQK